MHSLVFQSIAFDQGNYFIAKEVMGPYSWIRQSYHAPCSPPPEVDGLVEQWNGLLKIQLQPLLGENTWQGWGNVL